MKRVDRLAAVAALSAGLLAAMAAWVMKTQRREYYVSPRFLAWLRRQEEADRLEMERAVERAPLPFRPRAAAPEQTPTAAQAA